MGKSKQLVAPRKLGTSPSMVKIVVVAGPTSSGKSDLAILLARRFNGEIISADSRQVYRGMDVGTGKVTKHEQKLARHWLLDVASPKRQYSAAQWKKAAQKALVNITSRGKLPIICGGTGFWIDSLVYGLTIPEVKPDSRLRAKLAELSPAQLFARLKKLDPRRAKTIDRHNPRRLIRALEIVITTGKPVPRRTKKASYNILYLALQVPPNILKKRISARLDARLASGMITEIRRLHAAGVSWERLESFGLEYRWVSRFLQKRIPRKQMRDALLHDIIGYAKRQMTWLRRNPAIHWIPTPSQGQFLVKRFILS